MEDIYQKVIKEIETFVDVDPLIYKGLNLKSLLVSNLYIKILNNKTAVKYQDFWKRVFLIIVNKLKWQTSLQEFKNINSREYKFDYLFVIGFSRRDNRHFDILANLIDKLEDASSFLVVTNYQDVYEYYFNKGINCIFLKSGKYLLDKMCDKKELDLNQQRLLSEATSLLDYADQLIKRIALKVVLTTQDFHFFDHIFSFAGRNNGIVTITHQHGMIPDGSLTLYKFMYSDKMIVWGKNSRKRLSGYIDNNKLHIIGTDKFNYLRKQSFSRSRCYITFAINTMPESFNRSLLYKVLCQLNFLGDELLQKYIFVLKLHPAMEVNNWKEIISEEVIRSGFTAKYKVLKGGNEELLAKTEILIGYKSTISLEAFIMACSVIELIIEKDNILPNSLFEGIEESILKIDQLGAGLKRRIEDKKFNDVIVKKQNYNLKQEIAVFNSSKAEIEFLKTIQ